ncbi:MAG TPA: NAD(P)-binding domain-containing protein, partial [Myxococcales bacterium]|nr:NAD(P)-binding domain-containing protein [Myxococcales bacterium]
VAEAPKGAEVVALAVPFRALDDVLREAGDLAGQVVIDCTNAVERGWGLTYGGATSAAEELQKKLPRARVFKSFNAQGAENLANPVYGDARATNFFCGDDAAGKAMVKQLVEDVGFDAVDAGPLKNARLLEPLMIVWVTASQALQTRDLAFQLLRR